MNLMRRALLGFLTLLILTPTLTCVMPFCPMQTVQAAPTVRSGSATMVSPCHSSSSGEQKKGGPMLAQDCMEVTLFQQDVQANMPQPDLTLTAIPFDWAAILRENATQPHNQQTIRGPPKSNTPHTINLSILQTTRRLRI